MGGGGLVFESVGKADLMSDHFDTKQSRKSVYQQLICHRSPRLTTLAFRLSEVRRHLLDLDPYGGTDPLGMVNIFVRRTDVSAEFRRLAYQGSFIACWRQANVTPIPNRCSFLNKTYII